MTDEQYEFMTKSLTKKAKYKLANWLAHGMEISGATGIVLTRDDFNKKGECLVINHKGDEMVVPIEKVFE